jgi:hypothetical protein
VMKRSDVEGGFDIVEVIWGADEMTDSPDA